MDKPLIQDEAARRGLKLRGRGADRCGPCPVCGGGDDRLSINTKKQVFNCRICRKGGDVIAMIMHLDGSDFRTACATAGCELPSRKTGNGADHISRHRALADQIAWDMDSSRPLPKIIDMTAPGVEPFVDANSVKALEIWKETVAGGPLLNAYFARRKLLGALPLDDVIRFHPSCPFKGHGRRPCVVALYRDILTNEPRAIHRTALSKDGVKIGRMALGPIAGCAIKLTSDQDIGPGLTIGEGLETTLAGVLLGLGPAWAAGSANGIEKFPVLAGVETLTILVDNDANQVGPKAAAICSERWTMAGREVRRVMPRDVKDMADVLMQGVEEVPE
jgi:hypothetical protein